MPVVYEIDQSKNTIHTSCIGDVTLFEVLDHFRALVDDPSCPKELDVLLNLAEQETVPTSAQLRVVGEEMSRVRPRVQFGACAIVVATDALFGTAMVFEVIAARSFRVTRIFRELASATSWLEQEKFPN